MGYVQECNKHGQYKGDYCGECIDELYNENARLRKALESIAKASIGCECCTDGALNREELGDEARAALEKVKQCVSVPVQCVGGVCDRCRMEIRERNNV